MPTDEEYEAAQEAYTGFIGHVEGDGVFITNFQRKRALRAALDAAERARLGNTHGPDRTNAAPRQMN